MSRWVKVELEIGIVFFPSLSRFGQSISSYGLYSTTMIDCLVQIACCLSFLPFLLILGVLRALETFRGRFYWPSSKTRMRRFRGPKFIQHVVVVEQSSAGQAFWPLSINSRLSPTVRLPDRDKQLPSIFPSPKDLLDQSIETKQHLRAFTWQRAAI
jgi:hypothetical protein